MRQLRALDAFCGEGGTSVGLHRAGFQVVGVDKNKNRLKRYPFECHQGDAIEYILEHGHEYDLLVGGPTCTGYSRGTAAIPDRLTKYDRLIAATREAMLIVGKPYVIENVEDAKSELRNPIMLCGRQFGLNCSGLATADRSRRRIGHQADWRPPIIKMPRTGDSVRYLDRPLTTTARRS